MNPARSLRVHPDKRRFADEHGQPFLLLADTAWELFHRLDAAEAEHYLCDRAAKGFNAVLAVVLAELDGLRTPNALGDLPLLDLDPARPNPAYFRHVENVVRRANALGLNVGLLPTWGDKWNLKWGPGPEVFHPENGRAFGRFLGERFRDDGVFWVLGGDRPVETGGHRDLLRAMATGLREGDGGRHLMTFHPPGGHGSSEWCHDEPWLDFNLWQSGHVRGRANWRFIAADLARAPLKPTLDGEPGYEDHPDDFKPERGWLDAADARRSLYGALFAGAAGHVYGCHDVWQFWQPGRAPITHARTPWREALHLPGAGQMAHARRLLTARPDWSWVPAPELIAGPSPDDPSPALALRAADHLAVLVYLPQGQPVDIRTELIPEAAGGDQDPAGRHDAGAARAFRLTTRTPRVIGTSDGRQTRLMARLRSAPPDVIPLISRSLEISWFDPRSGNFRATGTITATGTFLFSAPTQGEDWVLVLGQAVPPLPSSG